MTTLQEKRPHRHSCHRRVGVKRLHNVADDGMLPSRKIQYLLRRFSLSSLDKLRHSQHSISSSFFFFTSIQSPDFTSHLTSGLPLSRDRSPRFRLAPTDF